MQIDIKEARPWTMSAADRRGVDFVAAPHRTTSPAAAGFYGDTLGLRRSVYMPERNYAEFETGNLTLSVIDAGGDGDRPQRQPQRDRAARR